MKKPKSAKPRPARAPSPGAAERFDQDHVWPVQPEAAGAWGLGLASLGFLGGPRRCLAWKVPQEVPRRPQEVLVS